MAEEAAVPFTEEDLHELYMWVDEVPISRPKHNIARDFADGCCVAEIVKFFFPKVVDLHNYVPAMSMPKKRDNWHTLNAKVFRKLYFEVPEEEIEDIVSAVPGAVERFLRALRIKISQIRAQRDQQQNMIGWGVNDDVDDGAGAAAGRRRPSAYEDSQRVVVRGGTDQRLSAGSAPSPAIARGSAGSSAPAARVVGAGLQPQQQQLLDEKDRTILELRETVAILGEKIMKLEELVRVKDEKLNQYRAKFGKV